MDVHEESAKVRHRALRAWLMQYRRETGLEFNKDMDNLAIDVWNAANERYASMYRKVFQQLMTRALLAEEKTRQLEEQLARRPRIVK